MHLETCHFEIHVDDPGAAEAFYVGVLGLGVLQRLPVAKLIALQAGGVRISVFHDADKADIDAAYRSGGRIIFRTLDLAKTVADLHAAGIETSAISEAPGFMKFVSLRDPSGNRLEIAEYLRDPLVAI